MICFTTLRSTASLRYQKIKNLFQNLHTELMTITLPRKQIDKKIEIFPKQISKFLRSVELLFFFNFLKRFHLILIPFNFIRINAKKIQLSYCYKMHLLYFLIDLIIKFFSLVKSIAQYLFICIFSPIKNIKRVFQNFELLNPLFCKKGQTMMRYIQYLHKIQPLYSTKLVSTKFNFLKTFLSSTISFIIF